MDCCDYIWYTPTSAGALPALPPCTVALAPCAGLVPSAGQRLARRAARPATLRVPRCLVQHTYHMCAAAPGLLLPPPARSWGCRAAVTDAGLPACPPARAQCPATAARPPAAPSTCGRTAARAAPPAAWTKRWTACLLQQQQQQWMGGQPRARPRREQGLRFRSSALGCWPCRCCCPWTPCCCGGGCLPSTWVATT
jgi:hypothetical protein